MRRVLLLEKVLKVPSFIEDIHSTIYEVKLFNLKLNYLNRIFSLEPLDYSQERRREIINQFDLTQGIEEVKLLYYTYMVEFYGNINIRTN